MPARSRPPAPRDAGAAARRGVPRPPQRPAPAHPAPRPAPRQRTPGNEHPGGLGQDLSAGQDGNPAGEHGGTNDDGPGAHGAGADPSDGRVRGEGDGEGPGGSHGPNDGDGPGPGGGPRRPGPGPGSGPGPGPGWLPAAGPGSGAGLTGTINLTVPLATWLGLTGQPGEVAGYGHLDAAACRDLAAAIAAGPGARWHLIITGPDGTAIGYGRARKGNPPPDDPPPPGGTGSPRRSLTSRRDRAARRSLTSRRDRAPRRSLTSRRGRAVRRPRTTRLDRQRRPAPLARGHQDQLAADRDLRACPGNIRIPAISHPAEPDQDPQRDLHLPGLPPDRPPMR